MRWQLHPKAVSVFLYFLVFWIKIINCTRGFCPHTFIWQAPIWCYELPCQNTNCCLCTEWWHFPKRPQHHYGFANGGPVIFISSANLVNMVWCQAKAWLKQSSLLANCTPSEGTQGNYPDSRFMGPTWDPPGADRTQVGPLWATWKLLSG